jgi:DNA-binding GntR family transcriptional regulator
VALPSDGKQVERVGSLADSAYEQLRGAIVRGELRPNERLVEQDLAAWLHVSRTPLRESLTRLAQEGLVSSERRGWVVRDHTADEVSEIHEVRAALEGMAAYLAAKRASNAQIAALADLHASQGGKAGALADRESLVEYNDAFHDAVLATSGSARLCHFARINREFFFAYRISKLFSDQQVRQAVSGHDAVVKALKRRDAEAAESAMRDHILEARDVIIRLLF